MHMSDCKIVMSHALLHMKLRLVGLTQCALLSVKAAHIVHVTKQCEGLQAILQPSPSPKYATAFDLCEGPHGVVQQAARHASSA